MTETIEYRGVVSECASGYDAYGLVVISVSVQNHSKVQPPVSLARFGGRHVRVTITIEDVSDVDR